MVDEVVEVLRRWIIGETSIPYQEIIVLLFEIIEGMDNIREKVYELDKNIVFVGFVSFSEFLFVDGRDK